MKRILRGALAVLMLAGTLTAAEAPPLTHFDVAVYGHSVSVDRDARVDLWSPDSSAYSAGSGLVASGGRTIPATACPLEPAPTSISLEKSQSLRLAPGSYTNLVARNSARLTLAPGSYRVEELKLKNSAVLTPEGPVVLFVGSRLEVENSARLNPGGAAADLQVYQADPSDRVRVFVKNSASATGALCGPAMEVEVANNASLHGSVVAGRVEVENQAAVHYDPRLKGVPIRR
ncbi:MAG: hypothetical protein AB1758_34930 [Candidatus Eremiobacterota bacterium]